MAHIVEVDQSIKVEQSGNTVLAFSDGISHAIVIPSKVKRVGFRALKEKGKSKERAQLLLFAAGVYLLLENHLDQLERVEIDVEYTEKDADIKSFLLRLIWGKAPTFEPERIIFRRVGKGSPADKKARAVREGRDKDYRQIAAEELLSLVT